MLSSKESGCNERRRHRRCRFNHWVRKTPWRRKQQPTLVFLPEKPLGQRSLVVYSPWGCRETTTLELCKKTRQEVKFWKWLAASYLNPGKVCTRKNWGPGCKPYFLMNTSIFGVERRRVSQLKKLRNSQGHKAEKQERLISQRLREEKETASDAEERQRDAII